MSDDPRGWAELLAATLGTRPVDATPLAALPCAFPLSNGRVRDGPRWLAEREP